MEYFPPLVVFDCNIFVQALLNPIGSAGKCFDLAREGRIVLFVSEATLNEVRTVIQRPHILLRLPNFTSEQIDAFLLEVLYI